MTRVNGTDWYRVNEFALVALQSLSVLLVLVIALSVASAASARFVAVVRGAVVHVVRAAAHDRACPQHGPRLRCAFPRRQPRANGPTRCARVHRSLRAKAATVRGCRGG